MKDKDIQNLLGQKEVHLSVRTICNCRKLLNIPHYRERVTHYYERNIPFSGRVRLSREILNKIPHEPGVYELSIPIKLDYPHYKSNVIYIGSSQNLRKRIANYSGNSLKNHCLKNFIDNNDVSVRFYLTENYVLVEKMLLKSFENTCGRLPKANSLGG